jgi:hypothetical protein
MLRPCGHGVRTRRGSRRPCPRHVGDALLAVEQGSTVSDDPGEAAAMLGRAGELRRRYGRPPSGSEEAASASTASAARRALGDVE